MWGLPALFSAKGSPTADLYLGWSCADQIVSGTIRQIGPTVFLAGRTLIVLRHDAELRATLDFDRLIYVIDDDWRAGLSETALPLDYRAKLQLVEAWAGPRLETAAEMIVVSSRALQATYRALYPDKSIAYLAPVWRGGRSDILGATHETKIAILGGRTHRSDLAFLAPIMADLIKMRPDLQFVVSAEAGLPKQLLRQCQVTRLPSMDWTTYQRWMQGRAFDIGLYPLGPSTFNAARSVNKLIEFDKFGAAVIGSERWTEAHDAFSRGQCVLLGDNPVAWRAEILRLANNPEYRHKLAQTNRDQIIPETQLALQRQFWQTVLFS